MMRCVEGLGGHGQCGMLLVEKPFSLFYELVFLHKMAFKFLGNWKCFGAQSAYGA